MNFSWTKLVITSQIFQNFIKKLDFLHHYTEDFI